MVRKIFLFTLILPLLIACKKEVPHQVNISYYYWKTGFSLDPIEEESIEQLNVKKIYVRYFDVALKNDLPVPVSSVVFKQPPPPDIQIVPVVYIKNEVMLSRVDIKDLSTRILDYIDQINKDNNLLIKEIQLDCDWSLQSKDNFMSLIENIAQSSKHKLSSTVRLHQVKHFKKTGIPKVDYGVLMYYNMGSISSDSINSIYDRNIANKYIKSLGSYPLELNIALPIYSWALQIRSGKVINLINRIRDNKIKNSSDFKKISNDRFIAINNCSLSGFMILKGDEIKIETITAEQLQEMAKDLSRNLATKPKEIILFDLDTTNINYYEKGFFKKIPAYF